MALKIIGAGFGRTGTESMKQALEILGFAPCHHMIEVLRNPEQEQYWRKAVVDNSFDWDQAFQGYQAAVDWPSAYYWRELSERYPKAKVLLTVRSAESWYESFSNTILEVIKNSPDSGALGKTLIAEQVFQGQPDNRDHAIAVYEQNIRDVQAAIPADRLLTYHTGSGWAPLCAFLNKDVPDQPYPRTNSTAEFLEHLKKMKGE
ncbi:MAG: sulfotransferase family protein [Gammaproteobacteria bacterium]|nr:sulfotransferase family protein [Gammaproteobacteria bacterium]